MLQCGWTPRTYQVEYRCHKRTSTIWLHLKDASKVVKFIETAIRMTVTREPLQRGGNGGLVFDEYSGSDLHDEEILEICFTTMWMYLTLLVPAGSVAQSCPTHCDPLDCSPPGSFVHGILQAGILKWVAISFSRGSSWLRDGARVSWGSLPLCCLGSQYYWTAC